MPIYTNDPYDDGFFPVEPSLRSSIGIGPKITEAIDAATSDWLEKHPEATTTVEDNSLTNAKFMDGSVNSRVIEDGSIATGDIADLAVTTPKIADNAVTSDKITSSAVDGLRTMSATQPGVAKVGAGLAMNNGAIELSGGNIATAVTAWLNAHPEATTTVQGGSITDQKIADDTISDSKLVKKDGILDFVRNLNAHTIGMFLFKMQEIPIYSGLSFTVNSDGKYVVSGTCTAATTLSAISQDEFVPEVGKTYKILVEYDTPPVPESVVYLFARGVNGTNTWIKETRTFTAETNDPIRLLFAAESGAVGQNVDLVGRISIIENLENRDLRYDVDRISNEISNYHVLSDTVDAIAEAAPTRSNIVTLISGSDGISWETGKFYSSQNGRIIKQSYASLSCAIFGPVYAGEKYYITNRDIGTGYSIYITSEDGTIIDHSTDHGSGYYSDDEYVVPQNGIMYLNADNVFINNNTYRLKKLEVSYDFSGASPLKDVKWCCFGDSLVEFNSTAENNWVKHMIAATSVINTNIGGSGTGFYRGAVDESHETGTNYITKLSIIPEDVELITVCGSFNDLMTSPWASLPVGTASDTGTATLAGYMNDFFAALIAAHPTVPIAVMMTSPWDVYKPGVVISDSYVNVLKEICQKNGIPFTDDCYRGCNLKPWVTENRVAYYTHPNQTVDGVHPNSEGHVFIYQMLKPFMEKCVHKV